MIDLNILWEYKNKTMDLYDDDVDVKKEEVKVSGWSSGIR